MPSSRSNSATSSSVSPPRAVMRSGGLRACGRWPAPAAIGRPGVVARPQHLGHLPPAELGRTGVLGVLEQALGERLVVRRFGVAHHAGHEPGDDLEHRHGRDLAAAEHVVADRQLVVDEMLPDSSVDAFVPAAQQREPVERRQLVGQRLVEPPATGPSRNSGRGGSTLSTERKIGSGMSTIPAPPPNGESSTERCGSFAPRAGRARARRAGRARDLCRAGSATRSRPPSSGRS